VVNGGPGFDHHSVSQSSFWENLARNFPVVLYDQRGTGKSVAKGRVADISVAGLIADLDELRQHLRAERVNLLGWSWGGYLAMAYAADDYRSVTSALRRWSQADDLT
jgi:proline iminopeptidase